VLSIVVVEVFIGVFVGKLKVEREGIPGWKM
jgi:hypothetical protein